jgi:hypothetical protein
VGVHVIVCAPLWVIYNTLLIKKKKIYLGGGEGLFQSGAFGFAEGLF